MREKQQRRKGSDLPPPASSQIHPRAPSSNSAENSLKRRTQIGEVDTDGSAAFGWSVFKHLSSINPFFVWKKSMSSSSKLFYFYYYFWKVNNINRQQSIHYAFIAKPGRIVDFIIVIWRNFRNWIYFGALQCNTQPDQTKETKWND